ncbi:MAG TPA: hypothetical protein VJJ48_00350 [Candidatus Paceibacterota bacterium]
MFKKFITLCLITSFITPLFFLPHQAKKAEAFLGFGDLVLDIKQWVDKISDSYAMIIVQPIIDRIVASTVKWAQSGFEGNPAYVTNPKQYFTDIADGVAGEFILGTDLAYLCSPFQANIKLSLTQQYYEPTPFQCTLTDIVGNIDDFYGDFSKGGWDAWFSMTQVPTNNPYDAYLKAKIELDSRIASAAGAQKNELDWNQGFLSWSDCLQKNPPAFVPGEDDGTEYGSVPKPNPHHVPGKAEGECIRRGQTQTPGSTIKDQLDKVLPTGLEKLVKVEHIDQLVSAFASGLLTRYVFGPKGLFAKNNRGSTPTPGVGGGRDTNVDERFGKIDLDGDLIPDGYDADQDAKLESLVDICFHGGRTPECNLSKTATSSPYFTPICQSVNNAARTLEGYLKFIDTYAEQLEGGGELKGRIIPPILQAPAGIYPYINIKDNVDNFKDKTNPDVWGDRTSEVNTVSDDVLSTIRNYKSSYFDSMEFGTNRFSVFIGKVLDSLTADGKDLDLTKKKGNAGGGLQDLMHNSAWIFRYFQEIKRGFGECINPNIASVPSVPVPQIIVPQEGGQCTVEGNEYEAALETAIAIAINNNPTIADSLNTTENSFAFLGVLVPEVRRLGLNATDRVLNGNNNPNRGDLIAVWREGDSDMERYDVIDSTGAGDRTIRAAAGARGGFVGFIPLSCTIEGGGRNCGCEEEPPTTPPTPFPGPTPTPTPTPTPNTPITIPIYAELNLTSGGILPDVAWFGGKVYIAFKQGNTVTLYRGSRELTQPEVVKTFTLQSSTENAFPRLTVSGGVLWLAYRDGVNIRLWRSDTDVIENLGAGYGDEPVALAGYVVASTSFGYIAWQDTPQYEIVRRSLTGTLLTSIRTGTTTGLNTILQNGSVVTIEDTVSGAYRVAWGTKPWRSGDAIVAQGLNGGVVGQLASATTTTFWIINQAQGTYFTPHMASDGAGFYAVTAWNATGIKIVVIKR